MDSDHTTHAEPTTAEIDARLAEDLAALDARIGAGTLADERLHVLLGWSSSWYWPYGDGAVIRLTDRQRAAVKAVATRAIAARGGAFADGIWTWRVDPSGNLRAMAGDAP